MKTAKIITLILLLCCNFLFGISSEALYQKIAKTYGSLSSFQAVIKQDNYFAQLDKSITYHGNIYFTKGRMVIRFNKPYFQRLSVSGGIVELYDSQSNTVFRSKMRPEFGKMNPVEILQLYWKKSTVNIQQGKGNLVNVFLKPFDDPVIVSISAVVNSESGIVQSLTWTNRNNDKVTYNFSSIKTNAKIPASVWQYTYPKDVQVVEQ
ncbi:MAG: outer membrane lipoprotein carrier protein LolA [Candidatus Cloacimonadota bacterium]|jgi:outer membrane lipoprotein-sorting protein|nr:outer membrane lipoprotein carrier protein LolA [Candidatus Cloacimonas sp.]MDI9572293.1 outer membrane lipoprotein carrier protein LolA [Candidatus Cloacimonadota bacterium]OQC73045.1 MAG: lipoprotein chaperone [Candidatus Cloacimonetes bacterium ADurb.Bin003]HNZ89296.1 outer membrane lipoprotein carrier protein LolA [Candidatus Cloacimonas acidaminovorans]NLM90435.1 outer membrane lipoprotein carrier protein LolA [Candidatus Cloacimonadota bacterium]